MRLSTRKLKHWLSGGKEEQTDLMESKVVGAVLRSNTGKVPLYPGDMWLPLQGWGHRCDGRQSLTSFTDTQGGWGGLMIRNSYFSLPLLFC